MKLTVEVFERHLGCWNFLCQSILFACIFSIVLLGLFTHSGYFVDRDEFGNFSRANYVANLSNSSSSFPSSNTSRRSNFSDQNAAILNGSLVYPDPFVDCYERLKSWIERKVSWKHILPIESNLFRGDCIHFDSRTMRTDNDSRLEIENEKKQPSREASFFLFQNAAHVLENGVYYIEFYEDNRTNFTEILARYDRCNIEWHNCDYVVNRFTTKCAPKLRMVKLNAAQNITLAPVSNESLSPSSAIAASYPDSLMFMNYWQPGNLWHSLYDSLLPAAMTSLLWRRDSFEQPVGWLEFLFKPKPNEPRVEQLPILKDLERILMLDVAKDRDVKFNDKQKLTNRRHFKFISVGFMKSYFRPLKWEGWSVVYAEPMISFYPCAAKRIRQYYNVSFQPPARERIDPLVVYLERDTEDNPNRVAIMKTIEELRLFGCPVTCVSVNPRRLSTGEIVRLMASASAVLGTEGAAFSNILFMTPGSGVFVMENRDLNRRFPTLFHVGVGSYLDLATIHMKFVSHFRSTGRHEVNLERLRRGFDVLFRRIEVNRESQLLTGKIGGFVKNYDKNDLA